MADTVTPAPPPSPRPIDRPFRLLAGVVAFVLVAGKCLMHASAHTADLDTGNYSNLAWGVLHGQGFYGSVLGRHHLGEHFSPVMALVAPLYLLWQSAYVLMALQGLAVAAGVMLTLRFAADRMAGAGFGGPGHAAERFGVNALLLAAMCLYPPLLATYGTQFQPIELGLPLVILAVMLLHAPPTRGATLGLAATTLLLLMTRESAPLSVLGLAVYAAAVRRRWRVAAVLTVVAAVWFAAAMGLVMPHFRDERRWGHVRFYGPREMWGLKSLYLLALVGGMGFLPLLGRRALWSCAAAVPGVLLNLSVARVPQVAFQGHYDAQLCAFFLVAAAHGATWAAAKLLQPRGRFGRRTAILLAGVALASAGLAAGKTHAQTVFQRYAEWWPRPADRRLIAEAEAAARRYAGAPVLMGGARVGPRVCHRPNYRAVRASTPRQWASWMPQRVEPGTIFLLEGEGYDPKNAARDVVRASGWAELVSRTPYLEVYRWPVDAPPAGTDAAQGYAWDGLDKSGALPKSR